jgi:inositol oxygenase
MDKKTFRNYTINNNSNDKSDKKLTKIHETYKLQRSNIDYDFNNYLIDKYCKFNCKTHFWTLFAGLDGIVDLSDPDTSLPNSLHALQTAEAIRKDGTYPDWFVLCGLIHDMGKIIYLSGNDEDGTSKNTQWAIVGDTFITGAPIPDSIVLPEFNELNNDHKNKINLYKSKCGLNNCSVSFGHDEYMYRLLKANNHKMPIEAEYIIRYHSLYAWHLDTDYDYLQNDDDFLMKNIVQEFNKFDLYTKNDAPEKNIKWSFQLREYYTSLVKKYISPDMMIKY